MAVRLRGRVEGSEPRAGAAAPPHTPMAECLLSQLSPGQSGRVQRIDPQSAARQRLQEMGLVRGTAVQFVRAAPLGDPIEIRVRGYHLSLRRQEAEAVVVEREEPR